MSRMVLDLDDALLPEAQEYFGTSTATATVNAALREVVKLSRCRPPARDSPKWAAVRAPIGEADKRRLRTELFEAIDSGEIDLSDDDCRPGRASE